ncbi:MAG TPA: GNAT family N-acetyltransferase [Paenibacillaceae bacterium]|nr:GNAT family N-acetyltransferase [Paenibacillaceae bacterium]
MSERGIIYFVNGEVQPEAVAELYRSSGIRRPYEDLARIEKMLTNANLTITAWDRERLVGIARSVTDFSYCCYLSDLAVDQGYQKRGIGKELIQQVKNQLSDEVALILLSAPGAMSYYPLVGFNKAENAWIVPRKG